MINLIIKIIKEYVDIDGIEITEDTNFLLDLQLTSFDIVSMIGELENDLGIEIEDKVLKDLETVGILAKYLEDKIK